MKILLLAPPGLRMMNPMTLEPDMLAPKTWVPLGIASLAAALRAEGFDVCMADLHDAGWEEVAGILAGSGADVVGISFFTFGRVTPQGALVGGHDEGADHVDAVQHPVLEKIGRASCRERV